VLQSSKERASIEEADIFRVFLINGTFFGRLPRKAASPAE
jgi:hypothetical protein